MPATRATNVQQRQEMARLADQGESYRAVAERTRVSFWTARKWIRQARRGGLSALVTTLGRPPTGPLSSFDPLVRYVALRLKRQHRTWGAAYVVKKMGEHPSSKSKPLPSPVQVWRYWRSLGDRLLPRRRPAQPKRTPAGVAHGVWQMDAKESVSVAGVGSVTFNQARDEFGRATVMHRIHPAEEPEQCIVKLTTAQVQQDCRIAFTQWGLPDAIQTDRASIFADADPTPFPTHLSLWWVGLGIEHRLVSSPLHNGCIERGHRTLNERTLVDQATHTWIRTVSDVGQVSLGGQRYGLGIAWAGQTVSIGFDPGQRQFVFTQVKPETKRGKRHPDLSPVRLDAKGLSVQDITGLPVALDDLPVRQLMLPLSMCYPQPVSQGV
jgi:hypothetical protein